MHRLLPFLSLAFTALAVTACGSDSADKTVADGSAAAGCEEATDALLAAGPGMLPGRRCLTCHTSGGSAGDEALSAGGTVFGAKKPATCNAGGISGAVVELLKADGTVAASTTTNAAGNFYFRQALAFPLKARITQNGKSFEMPMPATSGDCASCHNGTAIARLHVE
jgi:hypothetical protein